MEQAIANADGLDKLSLITQQLIDFGIRAGERILIAVLVFVVGRFLISLLNKFIRRLMDKRKVDVSIKTFVKSLVNILLTILLIISVVGALGVETTSFAALLASAGVAVGMALSGNLQNFAGGLVILCLLYTSENLDKRAVGPIYEAVKDWDEPVAIAVLPDHPTPVSYTHLQSQFHVHWPDRAGV